MFLDRLKIYVEAGRGGNGCLSFRREKYVEFGGPNGGNGGKGGDVYLVADREKTTLMDLSYKPHFKAASGENGASWDKSGRYGSDLEIFVPCGTVVKRDGVIVADLRKPQDRFLAALGGRGGRGNSSFKTHRNTAPKLAELGEPGESMDLELELRLIADVGFVGAPNAGKSTLLASITRARPKIADYPFTTLTPNLGVASWRGKSFIAADIPGLIEGAHAGRGMGVDFLRHVERTRVLVHLVDPYGAEGQTPEKVFRAIQKELALFSKKLAQKPMVIVVSKQDLTGADKVLRSFKKKIKKHKVVGISSVSNQGMDALLKEVVRLLDKHTQEENFVASKKMEPVREFVLDSTFRVEKTADGFSVFGKKVERMVRMTNFDQPEAVERLQNILRKMGIEKALERIGAVTGDPVQIGPMEFLFSPGRSAQE